MPLLSEATAPPRRNPNTEPLRRKRVSPGPGPISALRRKPLQIVLAFVSAVLVIDALVGERGLVERLKVRRQYREAAASLERLRHENGQLREQVRRLKEDPSAIEALARKDLGLLRPGELLFIIKDVKPKP
jgi:cell division protein FtsB